MVFIAYLYAVIDGFLMLFFRLPESPLAGYWLGTLVLAFASWAIGEYSIALAFRMNKTMIKEENLRIDHFQELSFAALRAGDKSAFKACNGIANEAYGKNFFTQITLSAASLWPLFISLGWMQHRFSDIEFAIPLTGWTAGYFPTFLICYIMVRFLSGKIMRTLRKSQS
ncbi:MAG: hypothetical protein ISR97_04695 [Nitrospira sp.]|nr:hypothetical protein [Nitrospira sp.]